MAGWWLPAKLAAKKKLTRSLLQQHLQQLQELW
jgi:hypothetical protein